MSHKIKENKTGPSLALSVVLLLLFLGLFLHIDVEEIWNAITSVPLPLLGGLLVLQVVTQGLLALQWYKITQLFLGKCSFIRIFYILSTGSVIEALTSGAKVGGEVTRVFALKQELSAACTLGNMACGVMALMISAFHCSPEAVNHSCGFMLLGAFLDGIDGRLARKLQVVPPMGKELDSFADAITFGIAPIPNLAKPS